MLLTRFEQNGHSAWVEVDAVFGVMCHVTRSSHEAAPGGGGLLATLLPDTGRDALLHIMCLQCLSSKSSESCRISSDMSAFLITAFGSPRSRGWPAATVPAGGVGEAPTRGEGPQYALSTAVSFACS